MNFNKVQELVEGINYPHLLAVEDVIWAKDTDTLYWIEDKDVYSAYITEGFEIQGDMHICNGDTQQGYWMTYIFPVSKEIPYDDFEEKFEEFM